MTRQVFAPCALAVGFALALGVASPSVAAQSAVRIDGIAAVVGGYAPGPGTDVIFRSDVDLRARVALAGRTQRLPLGALPAELLAATLDEMVGEVLIEREANRLRAGRPDDGAVSDEIVRFEAVAGGAGRLTRLLEELGAEAEELRVAARRRAYVNSFLRANLEGSTIVSDARVERVYRAGEHPFGDRPLDAVREPLRAWIARSALERDVGRWVRVLRSRTVVWVVAEWRSQSDARRTERAGSRAAAPSASRAEKAGRVGRKADTGYRSKPCDH